jgi:hypothetical protein
MDWAGKPHPAEMLVEWAAPMVPAIAAGCAASAAWLPLASFAAAGMIALTTGVVAMRLAGGAPLADEPGFEPVALEDIAAGTELLLDDPLVEMAPDSRVVQLFAGQEPTPGELVSRISDYLNDGRRGPLPAEETPEHRPVDASAALHSALANIRASLR